jgi:soluble lytic murein transglycosylase
MQLMPATARSLAGSLGLRYATRSLHDTETNLRLGVRYLRDMLRRFDGRIDHALAAYNAGPHRVDHWKASYADLTTEEFVETIPFTQTRLYVRNVLANRELYRRLYPAFAGSGEPVGDP